MSGIMTLKIVCVVFFGGGGGRKERWMGQGQFLESALKINGGNHLKMFPLPVVKGKRFIQMSTEYGFAKKNKRN